MRQWRGLTYLTWLTFRRQLAARKTVVALVLILLCALATLAWSRTFRLPPDADPARVTKAMNGFVEAILMPLFVSFLLPILALIYATAAIGEEREERTIVYLLIRPLSRYRIYLAKALGTVPLVLAVGLGGFALVCLASGRVGGICWDLFPMAIVRGCVAYTALFLLFGAIFPRPMILAVVYAFFCETLLGNMPGTIKRLTISYHCSCLMFDAGSIVGIHPDRERQFIPISGWAAAWVLDLASLALLALGAYLFHRKEYRDFAG